MSKPVFSKKARLPRKEKKRRAKLLNPPRKVKFRHKPLTYDSLTQLIKDVLFPEAPEGPALVPHRIVFLDADVDYKAREIKTEHLTFDEIKERYPLTTQEEEALREATGLGTSESAEITAQAEGERDEGEV